MALTFHSVIWVCQCCMLAHANGECCASDEHGGDGAQPLNRIEAPYSLAMGMDRRKHDCADDTEPEECDCEENSYSTSQCEGCGSYLHGERHAMTLFEQTTPEPAQPETVPDVLRRLYLS